MKPQNPNQTIHRRDFLRLAGLYGASAASVAVLNACRPSAYPTLVRETWETLPNKEKEMSDPITDMLTYASLAPSGHNTQPWKFHLGENTIEILPDFSRRLPVVDPDDRELYISLGCALENLLGAAGAFGFAARTDIFPTGLAAGIRITLTPGAEPDRTDLLSAMQNRQCTRTPYDGKPIPEKDWQELMSTAPETDIYLDGYRETQTREAWMTLVWEANLLQYSRKDFKEELIAWIRFNEEEALRTRDGLYSLCTGNPAAPRWLGSLFLNLSSPESVAATDEKNMRSSSAFVLLSSKADDPLAWVRTGQVFQRFALSATDRGLKLAFLNQPAEVPQIRSRVQETIAAEGAFPQLFLRLGYAQTAPRSLRRPLADVIV